MQTDLSTRTTIRACTRFALAALSTIFFLGFPATVACAAEKRKPSVLIVHAEPNTGWAPTVESLLFQSRQFSNVGLAESLSSIPTLDQLLPWDAVLVFSNGTFSDATQLGNTLADYVDAGGGVVNMTFSVATTSPPSGRWNPGYLCMASGGNSFTGPATLDLASITNQNHPMLIGVGSFDGGSSSYRADQTNVVAGASVVARWSDGRVLAASGPLPGRADLNFFPVSNIARADFWQRSTDGDKLIVNALLSVIRPRVLIAGATDSASWNNDVKAKIRATGLIGLTDILNIKTATPTLTQLNAYDAVLVWTDPLPANPTALGNVLADFVDEGGGVVKMHFATAFDDLAGRWLGTYDLITNANASTNGPASLGVITYPSHPALAGVASFNGGSASYRSATSSLNPGAFNIAQWSDGRPLVVASTKFSNRIDLNFFPPSSTVFANSWSAATDGGKLMANALVYVCKPYVACVGAAEATFVADPVAKLMASRRFSGVAAIDARLSTPTAATLKPFNALLTWSDYPYQNPTALGNNLADFADAGAGVVVSIFANVHDPSNYSLRGRWRAGGYDMCPAATLPNSISGSRATLGSILEFTHPINSFIRKFDGGPASIRPASNPLLRGREILRWSDGLVLASVHNFKKRVDLGMYPASSGTPGFPQAWEQRTDGTWLMANALEYSVYHTPCPGDLNGDGAVNDADFVLFVAYYNTLLDPRGDLTGDDITEDADFVVFVNSYDTLICP